MTDYAPMLKGVLAGLRPGGRLVIIELIDDAMRAQSRAEQNAKHQISDDLTAQELEAAGVRVVPQDPAFRPFTDPTGNARGG